MDDLISRQAAINAMCDACDAVTAACPHYPCKRYLAIESLQSVDAVKHGRWINHRNDNGHNIADCSECGNAIQWFDDDEKPKFCCMCGADMRGEKK